MMVLTGMVGFLQELDGSEATYKDQWEHGIELAHAIRVYILMLVEHP